MKAAVLIFVILLVSCSKKVTNSTEYESPTKDIAMVIPVENKPEPVIEEHKEVVESFLVIYFKLNSYELAESELQKLVQVDRPAKLKGGCCPLGESDYNYDLGLKRAYSVRNELQKRGIQVLDCISVGENELISEYDYERNRRCEITY